MYVRKSSLIEKKRRVLAKLIDFSLYSKSKIIIKV